MAAGRRQAGEVIKYRQDRLRARRAALERAAPRERLVTAKVRGDLAADLAPVSSGMLIAEGDSWFDYPWTDILSELEDRHGFEVESVSHRGDRIEAMAYQGGQLEKFVRTLEKLIRRGTIPDAILLSGGGNDVAGEEFAVLLNHAESPAPGLNDDVVEGVLERIRLSYITVLCAVASVCEDHLGVALPVLVHGYDYSVPDGRGFWGGWGPLPGPWLEPGFRQKGYDSDTQRLGIVRDLIDRFNTILSQLPQVSGLGHVRPVDLRGTLSTGGDYREWWANELHPTARGFESVAQKFVDAI
jgi:hypothetical protein